MFLKLFPAESIGILTLAIVLLIRAAEFIINKRYKK